MKKVVPIVFISVAYVLRDQGQKIFFFCIKKGERAKRSRKDLCINIETLF